MLPHVLTLNEKYVLTQWTWQGVRSWRCHVTNECSYVIQIGGVAAFCGESS